MKQCHLVLALSGALSVLGVLSLQPAAAIAAPPNVVVVFCDDLGYGDLACFGHPTLATPELDRMAAEGQRWTQFYVGASVCSPSRASLLTGRLPLRTGVGKDPRVFFEWSEDGMPGDEVTIAERLKSAGYATMCVGKWHLGHKPGFRPTDQGFDRYFGVPYSNDMRVDPGMPVADDCLFREGMSLEKMRDEQNKRGGWVPLWRGAEVVEYPADQTTLTRRYTEEALEFIGDHSDEPFFLYYAQNFPHIPLHSAAPWKDRSLRGLYGDVVEEVDWSVGQILQKLRDTGLAQRTLVVFTSDNGPWLPFKTHGGSAGLLREGKGTTWEGGMREPTIFWWPDTIAPGVVRELGSTLDFLPTFCALAGVAPPQDRPLDGYDLSPALLGKGPSPRKEMYFYREHKLYAARQGPYKAHFVTQGCYGSPPKQPETHDPPLLFQLEHDPSERFDVAGEHADAIESIRKLVEEHRKTLQ